MMNSKKNEKMPAGREALKVATSCQFLKQVHQLPQMGWRSRHGRLKAINPIQTSTR